MSENLKTPNAENFYEVHVKDIPIHCPIPGTSLWNSHPKVYVALDEEGQGKCPYCGAVYKIVN